VAGLRTRTRRGGRGWDAGRLEAGVLADVVVLDRDVFAAGPEENAEATVVGTWVGGEQVYAR